MNSTTTTNALLLLNTGLLVQLALPAWAPLTWLALGIAGLLWSLNWLSVTYQQKKAARAQKAADAKEWNQYWSAHQAIRAKYDPEHKWNEATSTPREYREEIAELNELHAAMRKRRFGDD